MNFWQSFGDILWWTIWVFAFFAYLWAVIGIITDLFRDHELAGWLKALWIVCLLFFPFVTALIYLIARGKGMADRSQKEAALAQQAAHDAIRHAAGASASPADEIAKAKTLLDAGVITQAEYEVLKAKALS